MAGKGHGYGLVLLHASDLLLHDDLQATIKARACTEVKEEVQKGSGA